MDQLSIYTTYKHDNESENLRINLDIVLTKENKKILYRYLKKFLKENFDLTYEESFWDKTGDNFELTEEEFELMINKAKTDGEYCMGEIIDAYLYPISVICRIRKDNCKSLQKIKLEYEMEKLDKLI